MRYTPIDPPRVFDVGRGEVIQLKDCAHIGLEPNEQVTFVTGSGAEYDVARKSWGFYATPSLNGRLQRFGLRGVLVKSSTRKFYIFLVERGKETDFHNYLTIEGHTIIHWLDCDSELEELERKVKSSVI
jgi:hypothetical protein